MKKLLSVFLAGACAFSALSLGAVTASAKAEKIIYGDADGSSKVNVKDTTAIQKYLAGAGNEVETFVADVNSDGVVNISDAMQIQKYNVHDLDSFVAERDADWRTSSIGYEIFVRSFYDSDGDGCGDFRGVAEKVDYLKSLNVGVVWLMPFNKSDSYHGYDVIDYRDICSDYGTKEDLRYMLDTLHDNGIKVIMDLVINHTGTKHPWFTDARKSKSSQYFDYYVWNNNRLSDRWTYNAYIPNWFYGCFGGNMPDLNYSNKKVWDEMDDIARYWLENGIDGFRLDAAMHIDDKLNSSGMHVDEKEDSVTHQWWQHFESTVKSINPDAFCVGEVWPETNMVDTQARFFADLDSDFDFSDMSEIKNFITGSDVKIGKTFSSYETRIKDYAKKTPDVPKKTINSVMLDNHDTNRIGYEIHTSSRLNSETKRYEERVKLAASVQMTIPGMPWIYYGDEIGQNGGGKDSSADNNRREPMDWYASRTGTGMTKMNTSVKNWGSEKFIQPNDGSSVEEQDSNENSILQHYRKLTEIRNKYKIFYTGDIALKAYVNKAAGYTITDDSRNYSMFVIHNNKAAEYTYTADCDFTDELSGKSYKKGDTITLGSLCSMIIPYTDTIPLV